MNTEELHIITKIYHVQCPSRWKDGFIKSTVTSNIKGAEFPYAKSIKCIDFRRIKAEIDHINAVILNKDEYGQYLTYEIII